MKLKRTFRNGMFPLLAILFSALTFSACKKDTPNERVPAAGLMSFNLVPEMDPIGVAVSGNIVTSIPLQYTNYTGGYQALFTGQRVVESFDWATREQLAQTTQNFMDSSYYSLFVVGTEGNISHVLVEDEIADLTDKESAYVRYIQAIPDSSMASVQITSGGTEVVNETAKYKTVSGFSKVSPGEVEVAVDNEGSYDNSRTISLEKGTVYTILLIGKPGNDDQPVEIKFVSNGTL